MRTDCCRSNDETEIFTMLAILAASALALHGCSVVAISNSRALRLGPREAFTSVPNFAFSLGKDEEHVFARQYLMENSDWETPLEIDEAINPDAPELLEDGIGEIITRDLHSWSRDQSLSMIKELVDECLKVLVPVQNSLILEERDIEVPDMKERVTPKSCALWWYMTEHYIAFANVIAKRVTKYGKQGSKLLVQTHGAPLFWESRYSPGNIFLQLLLQKTKDRIEPSNIALISCDLSINVVQTGMLGCVDTTGEGSVVNLTPWGLLAKKKKNKDNTTNHGNLALCYDETHPALPEVPFFLEPVLVNICMGDTGTPYVKDVDFEKFQGIEVEAFQIRKLVISTIERKSKELAKGTPLGKDIPNDFFTRIFCKISAGEDPEQAVAQGAVTLFAQLQKRKEEEEAEKLMEHIVSTYKKLKESRLRFKNQYYKSEVPDYVSQLKAFLAPYRDIFESQPNEQAKKWLSNHHCLNSLNKYWMAVNGQKEKCAACINAFLGVKSATPRRMCIPGFPAASACDRDPPCPLNVASTESNVDNSEYVAKICHAENTEDCNDENGGAGPAGALPPAAAAAYHTPVYAFGNADDDDEDELAL